MQNRTRNEMITAVKGVLVRLNSVMTVRSGPYQTIITVGLRRQLNLNTHLWSTTIQPFSFNLTRHFIFDRYLCALVESRIRLPSHTKRWRSCVQDMHFITKKDNKKWQGQLCHSGVNYNTGIDYCLKKRTI